MNKRLNKYIENNKILENLAPFECDATTPSEYLEKYFARRNPTTFFKDGTVQCINYSNRSFVDLYFLTKAKFPEVELNQVAYILLYELGYAKNKFPDAWVGAIKCPQIIKVVFLNNYSQYSNNYEIYNSFKEKDSYSSYGKATTVGSDGLSYNSILSMANKWIKKQNKLQNNG